MPRKVCTFVPAISYRKLVDLFPKTIRNCGTITGANNGTVVETYNFLKRDASFAQPSKSQGIKVIFVISALLVRSVLTRLGYNTVNAFGSLLGKVSFNVALANKRGEASTMDVKMTETSYLTTETKETTTTTEVLLSTVYTIF